MSLAIIQIGRVIQNANTFNTAQWNQMSMISNNFQNQVSEFLNLLKTRRIDYALAGGLALLQYVPGRNTEDMDLIITTPSLQLLPEVQIKEKNDLFAYGYYKELKVDFLFADNNLFELVMKQYVGLRLYEEGTIPTATIDGLILLKLYALPSLYRQFDMDRVAIYEADLTQLMYRTKDKAADFLAVLGKYMTPEDISSLSNILNEIQKKINRFKNGKQQ